MASGVQLGQEAVVTFSNSDAQYWKRPNKDGSYAIAGVMPGTYTETLYANELVVGTRTIKIAARSTTVADFVSTYYRPTATWRIGVWDGTPKGFLNADKIGTMHLSDSRMAPFVSPNFVVGMNSDADWPLAQFTGKNNGQKITFALTAAQAAQAQTLRIGITLGFEGGRNRVTVNAGQSYAWTSAIPSASRDLNSRGITRGTYRGDNKFYTYNIPSSALRAGVNTIDLPVVSGSSGTGFLSPNVVYDAIDLVPTSSLTNAPRGASIVINPAGKTVGTNAKQTFAAVAYDQSGNSIPANFNWSAVRGEVDAAGAYTAPDTGGSDTITVTSGTISKTVSITVVSPPDVTNTVLDDGTAQRSRVRSLTVTFDRAVTLGANAFTLFRRVSASAVATEVTGFAVESKNAGSVYVLSFASRAFPGRSLENGLYELRVNAAAVTDVGGVAMSGNTAFSFSRLAMDIDGNRMVDFNDFLRLQTAFGSVAGPGFVSALDVDDNGVIDFNDFLVLQVAFGSSI